MRFVIPLFIIAASVLSSCASDNPQRQSEKPISPTAASKVLYAPATNLPAWAAWLGPPVRGERVVAFSTEEEQRVSYLSGDDILRAQTGRPLQKAIVIQTQKNKLRSNLKDALKPSRLIDTAIGEAYIQPNGLRAYIPASQSRVVIVSVPNSGKMRSTLKYLRWLSSVDGGRDVDTLRGRR